MDWMPTGEETLAVGFWEVWNSDFEGDEAETVSSGGVIACPNISHTGSARLGSGVGSYVFSTPISLDGDSGARLEASDGQEG